MDFFKAWVKLMEKKILKASASNPSHVHRDISNQKVPLDAQAIEITKAESSN
jgi:hypothetical protein